MTATSIDSAYTLASIGKRILAFLIDFIIYWILSYLMGLLFGTPIEGEPGYRLEVWTSMVLLGSVFVLWPLSEAVFGQTLGKRILGLKVVNDYYKPMSFKQAFIRFFMGFVDGILGLGILIAANSEWHRRLGDMVAKTLVIQLPKKSV